MFWEHEVGMSLWERFQLLGTKVNQCQFQEKKKRSKAKNAYRNNSASSNGFLLLDIWQFSNCLVSPQTHLPCFTKE